MMLIESLIEGKSLKRKLITGSVDVNTGQFVSLDFDDLEPSEYVQAVLASASIPGIFPPTKLRDYLLIDGGTTWNLNIVGAIDKCRKMGFKDQDIVLDIII